MGDDSRRCSRCHHTFPLTPRHFYRDGLKLCKTCKKCSDYSRTRKRKDWRAGNGAGEILKQEGTWHSTPRDLIEQRMSSHLVAYEIEVTHREWELFMRAATGVRFSIRKED